MTSYLKFIGNECYSSAPCKWRDAVNNGCIFDAIRDLSPANQLRFIADQTLALSYFFWLYAGAHEFMTVYSKTVKEYTDNVLSTLTLDDQESLVYHAIKARL